MEVHSAVGAVGSIEEPFVKAVDVEAVEAAHDPESMPQLVLLEAH